MNVRSGSTLSLNSSNKELGTIISAARFRLAFPIMTFCGNRENMSGRCWLVGLICVHASRNVCSLRRDKSSIASNRLDFPTELGPAMHVNGPKSTVTFWRFLNPETSKRVSMSIPRQVVVYSNFMIAQVGAAVSLGVSNFRVAVVLREVGCGVSSDARCPGLRGDHGGVDAGFVLGAYRSLCWTPWDVFQ